MLPGNVSFQGMYASNQLRRGEIQLESVTTSGSFPGKRWSDYARTVCFGYDILIGTLHVRDRQAY